MLIRARSLAASLVLSLALASVSDAGVPDAAFSSVEMNMVGNSSGALMGDGFRVVVRDVNNVPLSGKLVELRFPPAVRPYTAQASGTTVNCASNRISKLNTPGTGVAVFQPRIGGYTNANDVQVVAEGVLLAQVRARSTDLNANGATEIGDFNHFRLNFLLSPGNLETDFDDSGLTDVADFNLFRMIYLNDAPGTVCP